MNEPRGFTQAHGVVISLFLHVCFALLFVALTMHAPRKRWHASNRLNVEVFGMLANRQTAAQQKRVESRPRRQDKQEVKPEITPKETPPAEVHAVQSASPVDTHAAVKLPGIPAAPDTGSPSPGTQGRAGGDFQQRQQFTGGRNDAIDVLNAYLSQLTRRLRANLIYPQEAKKKKLEGVSLISFVVTDSGAIKPNTLTVKKSSGYALLDASALKTAELSAPFQKPPRELSVSIAVDFEMDR